LFSFKQRKRPSPVFFYSIRYGPSDGSRNCHFPLEKKCHPLHWWHRRRGARMMHLLTKESLTDSAKSISVTSFCSSRSSAAPNAKTCGESCRPRTAKPVSGFPRSRSQRQAQALPTGCTAAAARVYTVVVHGMKIRAHSPNIPSPQAGTPKSFGDTCQCQPPHVRCLRLAPPRADPSGNRSTLTRSAVERGSVIACPGLNRTGKLGKGWIGDGYIFHRPHGTLPAPQSSELTNQACGTRKK
jgi:hypothetical protein